MIERPLRGWNLLIQTATRDGFFSEALHLYSSMVNSGISGDNFTFPFIAKSCGKLGFLRDGKKIHAQSLVLDFKSDVYVQTSLIEMYSKCSSLSDAEKVFDKMPRRNVATWNSMISAYSNRNDISKAFHLLRRMRDIRDDLNSRTLVSIILGCGCSEQGSSVHCFAIKFGFLSDMCLLNSIMSMYISFDFMESARSLFDSAVDRSTISCTVMMGAYVKVGDYIQVFKLFKHMQKEQIDLDSIVIISLISGASMSGNYVCGSMVHCLLIKNGLGLHHDENIMSSLVRMYANFRDISSARKIFNSTLEKNVSLWTSMISGYLQSGSGAEALALSEELMAHAAKIQPNEVTIKVILSACADTGSTMIGEKVENYLRANGLLDLKIQASLLRMYCKAGNIAKAKQIFDRVSNKDLIFWSTMISGYACNGKGIEALLLFNLMVREEGIFPDSLVFTDVISACNHSGLVEEGLKHFNSMQEEYRIEPSWEHYLGIVDLLGRSGNFELAIKLARRAPARAREGVWKLLLRACRDRHGCQFEEVVIGKLVDSKVLSAEEHVLLGSICASLGMWKEALDFRNHIKDEELFKLHGWSRIECCA